MELSIAKAINAGLRSAMDEDPKVVLLGEDIGRLGGVFRVTDGLLKDFGDQRVMDTPLAESAIVGASVGLAYRGFRPVVEIQFDGFVYPAYDQIVNQVARLRFRSSGAVTVPMVIRIPFGGGIGAVEHHSESPEAQFIMTAGLTVVAPSTPHDAFWMIQQAIASDDPVIFQPSGLMLLDADINSFVWLSRVATLYYFAYFLIILPVLGLTETPLPVPESISEPVLSHPATTPAGAVASPEKRG